MPTPDKTYSLRSSESLHSPSWLNDSVGSVGKSNRSRNALSSSNSDIKSRLRGRETISPPVWLTGSESLKRRPSRVIPDNASGKAYSKGEKKTTATRKRKVIERNLDTLYENDYARDTTESAEMDNLKVSEPINVNTEDNITSDNLDNTHTISNNVEVAALSHDNDSVGTDEDQYFDTNTHLDDFIGTTEENGLDELETMPATIENANPVGHLENDEEQTASSTDDSTPISFNETDKEIIVVSDEVVEENPITTTQQQPDQKVTSDTTSQSTSVYIDITRTAFEIFGASRFLQVISGQGSKEENEKLKLITSSSNLLSESESSQSKSNLEILSNKPVSIEALEANTSTVHAASPTKTHESEVVEKRINSLNNLTADNRQSFDGGQWKSRQSFLPSPSPSQVSYSAGYTRENVKRLNSILNSQGIIPIDESNENLLRRSDKYLSSSSLEQTTNTGRDFAPDIDRLHEERYQNALQPMYDRKRDASSQYFELPFSKRRAFEEYNAGVTTNEHQQKNSILGSGYSSSSQQQQQQQLKSYTPSQMTVLDTPSTQPKSMIKGNISTLSDVLIHPARQSISASKKQTMSFLQRRRYDEKSRGGNEPSLSLSLVKSNVPLKSETKASTVVANRILSSLSTLASPLEERSNRQTNLGNQSVLQRFGINTDKITDTNNGSETLVSSSKQQSKPKISHINENVNVNFSFPVVTASTQKNITPTTTTYVNNEFIFKPPKASTVVSTEPLNNLSSTDSIKFSFSPPGAKSKPRVALQPPALAMTTSDVKDKIATVSVPSLPSAVATTTKRVEGSFQLPVSSNAPAVKSIAPQLPSVVPSIVASQLTAVVDAPAKDSPWALAMKKDTIKCPSCFVPNEKSAIKCISCENVLAADSNPSNNVPKATESLGGAISSSGFQFSMPKSTPVYAPTQHLPVPSSVTTSSAPSFGFTFPAPTEERKVDKPSTEKSHEGSSFSSTESGTTTKKRSFYEESAPLEVKDTPIAFKPFSPPKPFSSSNDNTGFPSGSSQTMFSFSEASNKPLPSSSSSSSAVGFPGFGVDSHPPKQPIASTTSNTGMFAIGNPLSSLSSSGATTAAPFMFGQAQPPPAIKPDALVSLSKPIDQFGAVNSSTITEPKLGTGISSNFSFSQPSTTLPAFNAAPFQAGVSSTPSTSFSFGASGGAPAGTTGKSVSDKPSGFSFGAFAEVKNDISSSVSNSNVVVGGEAPIFGSTSDKPVVPFMFGSSAPPASDKISSLTTFGGSANDKQLPFPAFGVLNGTDKLSSIPAAGMGLQLNVSDNKPFGSPNAVFGSTAIVSGMDSPNSAMDMGSGYNSGDGSNMGFAASALGSSTPSQPFPSFANSLVPASSVAASPFSFGGNAGNTSSSGIAFGTSSSGNQNSFMFQGSNNSGISLPKLPTDGGGPFGFNAQPNFGNVSSSGMFGGPSSASQPQQSGGAFNLGSSDPNKQGAATGARRKLKARRP